MPNIILKSRINDSIAADDTSKLAKEDIGGKLVGISQMKGLAFAETFSPVKSALPLCNDIAGLSSHILLPLSPCILDHSPILAFRQQHQN